MGNSIIQLSAWDLALAAVLIVINAAVSIWLHLGLEKKIFVASLRTVVQLILVGYVLEFVFALKEWYAVMGILLIMSIAAGQAAVGRVDYRTRGIYGISLLMTFTASMLITVYGCWIVIGVEPWYRPQYIIPVAGMLLGNTMTGISLGLNRLLGQLIDRRDYVESLLAHGATTWQASRDVVRNAVTAGMIPILNSMAVVGIVSLPGMMTGQILAGASPLDAVRYQIVILFLIAAGTALGTISGVFAMLRLVFDRRHRLRLDRVRHA